LESRLDSIGGPENELEGVRQLAHLRVPERPVEPAPHCHCRSKLRPARGIAREANRAKKRLFVDEHDEAEPRRRRLRLEANVLERPGVEQPPERGRKRRAIGCPQMVKKASVGTRTFPRTFDFSKRLSQGDQSDEYQRRQGSSRIAPSPRPLGGTALALLRRYRALHTETTAEEAKGLDDRKL